MARSGVSLPARLGLLVLLPLGALAVIPATSGCSGAEEKPDPKPTGGLKPDGSEAGGSPELIPAEKQELGELGGTSLEAAEDGPWQVRRPARGPGGNKMDFEDVAVEGELAAPAEAFLADEPAPAAKAGGGAPRRAMAPEPTMAPPGSPPAGDYGIPPPPTQAGPLKAGSTDDNEAFPEFLTFLGEWSRRAELGQRMSVLDVSDRRYVTVSDEKGHPLPGAEVRILDGNTEKELFVGTTYGDGRVPFFPKVSGIAEGAPLIVEARHLARQKNLTTTLSAGAVDLVLDSARPAGPIPVDALFLIDTTGSMGDEIAQVKSTLLAVTDRLRGQAQNVDLRYAAVLYRDVTDDYVTSTHPFTRDLEAFDSALKSIDAGGGGDFPESLNQGLAQAVSGVAWRRTAAKVVFLIADAPPHTDYEGDVAYGESLKQALARGIRIHAVAASGLDPFGTLVFRQTAQYTRGRFIFIEYGSPAASAEAHGVTGPVKSNNLDDILYEQLAREIAEYGRRDAT